MPKPSAEDLDAARECIKDAFRSRPFIPFHESQFFSAIPSSLPKQFGDAAADSDRLRAALGTAIEEAETACPGLRIRLRDNLYGFDISVTGDAEWVDAIRFAHGGDEDAARKLSPPSAELLERVGSGELTGQFRTERSVRHRIRFFGFFADFETLLAEIREKKGIEIAMEDDGKPRVHGKRFLRFRLVSRHDLTKPPSGYNPVLPDHTGRLPGRREFRRWFIAMLAEAPFTGGGPALLWSIHSRREFLRCFPDSAWADYNRSGPLVTLLTVLRSHSAFKIGWDFSDQKNVWSVTVGPASTWKETYLALKAELSKPTTESEFGISPAAAVLYDWVSSLPPSSLDLGLTPDVTEEIRKSRLLLDCPWATENLRLYLDLLCEEITGRTPLRLRVVDWRLSGSTVSRILVRKAG